MVLLFTLEKAKVKNPNIPEATMVVDRPGVPGVDSPRPGIGIVSRFPRPAIPGIDFPCGPGMANQDIRIPPTACPMPGTRAPGSAVMSQFPGPGNPPPGTVTKSRLPAPDFQTPNPSINVSEPACASNP